MKVGKIALSLIIISSIALMILGFWGPSYEFHSKVQIAENQQQNYFDFLEKANQYTAWKSNVKKVQKGAKKNEFILTISENDEHLHRLETISIQQTKAEIFVVHPYYENTISIKTLNSSSIEIEQSIKGNGFFEHIFMPLIASEISSEYLTDYKKAIEIMP